MRIFGCDNFQLNLNFILNRYKLLLFVCLPNYRLDKHDCTGIFDDLPEDEQPSPFEFLMGNRPMPPSYYLPYTNEDNVVLGYIYFSFKFLKQLMKLDQYFGILFAFSSFSTLRSKVYLSKCLKYKNTSVLRFLTGKYKLINFKKLHTGCSIVLASAELFFSLYDI